MRGTKEIYLILLILIFFTFICLPVIATYNVCLDTKIGCRLREKGDTGLHPNQMAIDNNGNLYIICETRNVIKKYTNEGNFITLWGSWGKNYSEFDSFIDIAIGENNSVFIADRIIEALNYSYYPPTIHTANESWRIQKFDENGNFLFQWNDSEISSLYTENKGLSLDGIATDSNGVLYSLYVGVYPKCNIIYKYDENGQFIEIIELKSKILHTCGSGIVIDNKGNIYQYGRFYGLRYNTFIQKFSDNGSLLWDKQWNYGYINSIAVNFDEHVFFQDPEGFFIELDTDGNTISKKNITDENGNLIYPKSLVVF